MDGIHFNSSRSNKVTGLKFSYNNNVIDQQNNEDKVFSDIDDYATNPTPQDVRYIFNWEDHLNENKKQSLNHIN